MSSPNPARGLANAAMLVFKNGAPVGSNGGKHLGVNLGEGLSVTSTTNGLANLAVTGSVDPYPAATTQADWWINALTGDDTNDGATPATALRTHAELSKRVSGRMVSPPIDPSVGASVVYVHIASDLPDPDALSVQWFLDRDTALYYVAEGATVLASSTFTAVTDKDPTLNAPFEMEAAGLVGGFVPYIGKRVRITSPGANENAVMWIARDLGGPMRPSDPSIPAALWPIALYPGFPGANFLWRDTFPVTPVVGETFVIEDLRVITMGSFQVRALGSGVNLQNAMVVFGGLEFRESDGAAANVWSPGAPTDECTIQTWGCKITPAVSPKTTIYASLNDLLDHGAILNEGWYHEKLGGLTCSDATPTWARFGLTSTPPLFLARDTFLQGCSLRGAALQISSCSVFEATNISENRGGHAVNVGLRIQDRPLYQGPGATACFGPVWGAADTPRLWGSGSVGYGVFVASGSCLSYRTGILPSIIADDGDFALGDAGSGYGIAANGAIQATFANTWANLAAAQPLGGGGNAHNLARSASIVDGL